MSAPFSPDPSCQDPVEAPELKPVDEARHALFQAVSVVPGEGEVALSAARGRVLSADVVARADVPGHNNSAMDGFAVRAADLPEVGSSAEFEIVASAWAGQPATVPVAAGEAVQVTTGAVMPRGADTVVIQERVRRDASRLTVLGGERAHANVRLAGEDIRRGEVALRAGVRLGAAEIGFLASLGVARVAVHRRLRVALFSTGDELVALESGRALAAGEVYDSNRYSVTAALADLDVDLVDLGIVADDAEATRKAFERAARDADVVIATGGASVSEADHVARTLREMGEVTFWRVAMRPGRPLASGRVGQAQFFGLPGNPVATLVSYYQFVQPALKKMMGMDELFPPVFKARCQSALKKSAGRVEYQRGVVGQVDGEVVVHTTGRQGAGRLSSMVQANCFIVLHADQSGVETGDWVDVQPFDALC